MRERWFNFRPLLLIFLFLLLGSLFAFYITRELIACIIIFVITLALLITTTVIKKKFRYLLIPAISLLVGIGFYCIAVVPFYNNKYEELPSSIKANLMIIIYMFMPIVVL